MNIFYKILIVLLSIITILSCAYYKSKNKKEGLTNNDFIVLMGDSVLNNANYVPQESSVVAMLQKKTNENKILNVAKDGATIADLYGQLEKIPINLNRSDTYIFISAGGNNILKDHTNVKKLFSTYQEFLKALRTKLGSVKINILNLYQPTNPRYKLYEESIKQWNQLIEENSNKIGEMYYVIDLHSLLTNTNDFVHDIEPSASASAKIANVIYLTT